MDPLSPQEEDVWRALVRLMVVLPRVMDEDLQSGAGLSLTHYLVLMRLSEAEDQRLRMRDLADRAALSPSRMTRIVQSLQAQGLIERVGSDQDGRTNYAILTDAGQERLRRAWPTHLASARNTVVDHLDPAHLPEIAAVIRRITAAANRPAALRMSDGPPVVADDPAEGATTQASSATS